MARVLGKSALRPTFARSTLSPLRQQAAPALAQSFARRWASTDSNKDGKIHQVIGAVVDGMCATIKILSFSYRSSGIASSSLRRQLNITDMALTIDRNSEIRWRHSSSHSQRSRDREQRPEVGVGGRGTIYQFSKSQKSFTDNSYSNIWARASSDVLPWTVSLLTPSSLAHLSNRCKNRYRGSHPWPQSY